ncbi:MAG: TldD/PmbA family protein [Thermotogae bacterium]|nr:TldD/PmbA family protein [Thermotogota bacterium]
MTFEEFKDRVFSVARKKGFDHCQLHLNNTHEFEVMVCDGKVDRYKDARHLKIHFKGLKGDKAGFAVTEIMDEDSANMLVEEAYENLKVVESPDKEFLHDGSGKYEDLKLYTGDFERLTGAEKIELAKKMEKVAKGYDGRIVKVPMNVVGHFGVTERIVNTLGLDVSFSNEGGYAYCSLLASEGDNPKEGFKAVVVKKPEELDVEEVARFAAEEGIKKIGARSLPSGKYTLLIRRNAFAQILGWFSVMFSAERVQKKLSPLAGKLNERIGVERLTIIDDPHMERSFTSRPFDTDGYPTSRKRVVEKGILKTFLHNLKTAHKDGVTSTGNARGSGAGFMNIVVEPGSLSYEELIKSVERGILIIDVAGIHAGCDPISGNYSISAEGFMVENGEITYPVEQITISGNILDMFKNISLVGNDTDLELTLSPNTLAYLPSVVVESVDVAGK